MQPSIVDASKKSSPQALSAGVVKVTSSIVKKTARLYPSITREVWTPSFGCWDFQQHYRMASQSILEQEVSQESLTYRRVLTETLDDILSGQNPVISSCPGRLTDPWCSLGTACLTHLYRFMMARVLTSFLRIFLPSCPEEDLEDISGRVLSSYVGLMICLNRCFDQRTLLEQLSISSAYPETCLKKLQEEGATVPAVPMESYMVSPWLERVEVEELTVELTARMVELVEADPTLASLLCILTAFSPTKHQVDGQEESVLRQYRERISGLVYEHLYTRHDSDSVLASEKLAKIVAVLGQLDVMGSTKWIFSDGFSTEQGVPDLGQIELVPLRMGLEKY